MTDQGPDGYVFGVADTAFCCWEYDLIERNVRFLTGLDTEYYGRLAEILSEHLGGDGGGTASIALRAAYHQGVETLFSMLGAYAQAPECVPAWLACCKSEDLRKIVEGLAGAARCSHRWADASSVSMTWPRTSFAVSGWTRLAPSPRAHDSLGSGDGSLVSFWTRQRALSTTPSSTGNG